jgi:hypothetical protein
MENRLIVINNRRRPAIDGKPLKDSLSKYIQVAIQYHSVKNMNDLLGLDTYAYQLGKALESINEETDFFSIDDVWVYKFDPEIQSSGHSLTNIISDQGNSEIISRYMLEILGYWQDCHNDWHSGKVEKGYLSNRGYLPYDDLVSGDYLQYGNNFYEDADDAFQCDSSIFIDAYHSSGPKILDADANIWIGFEIEKEDKDVLLSRTLQEYKNDFPNWRLERDGSLDEYGFEAISPVYPLNNNKERQFIESDVLKLSEYVDADFSSNCGFHISVSTRAARNGNMETLYRKIENWMPLFYALYPSRTGGDYSGAKNKGEDSKRRSCLYNAGSRVEIRIFPACLNVENVLFRIDLVRYILKNTISDAHEIQSHFKNRTFLNLLDRIYGGDSDRLNSLIRRTWKYASDYDFSTPETETETVF